MLAKEFVCFVSLLCIAQVFALPHLEAMKIPSWMEEIHDPETNMTMKEAVTYHGYPFEEYTIRSEDGYSTKFHRIPYGKKNTDTRNRQPVFIMHGITGMSSLYIANIPEKNLPYFLAEEGYDVWLGNARGNHYSREHEKYTVENQEFWTFGWQEMAYYDIPVMIDFILMKTGFQQVHYIGHSMGTTIAFAMLCMRPEYNQKLKGLYALAPVAYLRHAEGFLKIIALNIKIIRALAIALKLYEFRHDSSILEKFIQINHCDVPFKIACKLANSENANSMLRINLTRTPVFEKFGISSTPMQALFHYGQLIKKRNFQQYDYEEEKNQEIYGQPTPPEFDLSAVTVPVALLYASVDSLAHPDDVALLKSKISSPILLDLLVPDPDFLHLEFLWSFNVQRYVHDPLLAVMKKQDES